MFNFRTLGKLARPVQLLLATITYSLGAGIARYLGHPIHAAAFGLGLLSILSIQVASNWLVEYFRLPLTPLEKDETPRHREAFRGFLPWGSLPGCAVPICNRIAYCCRSNHRNLAPDPPNAIIGRRNHYFDCTFFYWICRASDAPFRSGLWRVDLGYSVGYTLSGIVFLASIRRFPPVAELCNFPTYSTRIGIFIG